MREINHPYATVGKDLPELRSTRRWMFSTTIWLCAAALLAYQSLAFANSGQSRSAEVPATSADTSHFVVWDATLYKNKPDLTKYGMRPLKIIYGQFFWKDKKDMDNLPDEQQAKRLAREAAQQGTVVCIDIEHWPVKGDGAVVEQSVQKYVQLMRWVHEAAHGEQFGYYGVVPVGDYWRVVAGRETRRYKSWQADSDRIRQIADSVDVIFPSLYTPYPDQNGWVRYAIGQLREARKYGKPVYAFLWPQYHSSSWLLGGKYLPADFWKLELETVKKYADGAVIWGGWNFSENQPAQWDNNATWWQTTKEFLKSLN